MKWMLDTDTCIAIIKKHPIALKKLRGKSIGQVGISSITLGELAFGAEKSSRPQDAGAALDEFLLALEIAAFDEHAAMRYGELRGSLARRGKPLIGKRCWSTSDARRDRECCPGQRAC